MLHIAIYIESLSNVHFNFGKSQDVINPQLLFLIRDCLEQMSFKSTKIWLFKEKFTDITDHILFGFHYEILEIDEHFAMFDSSTFNDELANIMGLKKSQIMLLSDTNLSDAKKENALFCQYENKNYKIEDISDWLRLQRNCIDDYD